ncbi:MAG: DUF1934 domain-containing protein [Oscillospiraceae bacterium]|nr:DUF1934 domain-containing protein [Oscillospiraceae bacterium]
MKQDVSINIKSVQASGEDRDTTELFTCGNLLYKRGDYTLSYNENEAAGYGSSKISLDITGDNMVVMRRHDERGKSMSSLVIEKGKKHHCHYGTPYGDFMVGISADDVQCNLGEGGGDMYLKYTIDINSTLMSQNEMFINFEKIGEQQ